MLLKNQAQISLISLCVIALSCNDKEIRNNDLKELNLKGQIKSVKETEFEAIDKIGKFEKGKESFTKYYVFDERGNKLEDSRYWHEDLKEKTLFFYNQQNQLTEQRRVFGMSHVNLWNNQLGELNEVLKFEYHNDIHNQPVYRLSKPGSYEATRFSVINDSTIFLYDKNGNLLGKESYQSNRNSYAIEEEVSVPDVHLTLFNKNGRILMSIYGSEIYEELVDEKTRQRRKELSRNRIQAIGFDTPKLGKKIRFDTVWVHRYEYEYNDDILLSETRSFKQEGSKTGGIFSIKTTYNEFGDVASESTTASDILMSTPIGYDPNRIVTYAYTYDKDNNWITKTKLLNGIVQSIFEREYVYY